MICKNHVMIYKNQSVISRKDSGVVKKRCVCRQEKNWHMRILHGITSYFFVVTRKSRTFAADLCLTKTHCLKIKETKHNY